MRGSGLARAATLAALVVAVNAPALAHACINAVIEATDANVAALRRADALLEEGQPAEAAAIALRTVNEVPAFVGEPPRAFGPGAHLLSRAYRVVALAAVRLDGDLTIWAPVKTAAERRENVRWAVGRLDALTQLRRQDPGSVTDFGEALELSFPSKASLLLEGLAKKDLVATAYGYAALARLRARSNDVSGRDAALARCALMTKTPAICTAKAKS